jgi:hypothetical protein
MVKRTGGKHQKEIESYVEIVAPLRPFVIHFVQARVRG